MGQKITSEFITRQFMNSMDFELYYYEDAKQPPVIQHTHDYYELYFFFEGNVNYVIQDKTYHLSTGDFLILPPKLSHGPIFLDFCRPYRRFVVWIHPEFFHQIMNQWEDLYQCFRYAISEHCYHYHTGALTFQEIQGRLVQIITEKKSSVCFHQTEAQLLLASLLVKLNRIIYEQNHSIVTKAEVDRYQMICNYIAQNLDSDLSLATLSQQFFLSKYYIAHLFKQTIGISLHQYIIKKRLESIQLAILSGAVISDVYLQYGFKDYSSFYRAFKKEFGCSPKEFRATFALTSHLQE